MPPATRERPDALTSGTVSTARPSGTGASGSKRRSGRVRHERIEEVDVEDPTVCCGAASEMEGPVLSGWWSSAAALQEAANHAELLRSRAVVVSVDGEGAPWARHVWAKKASMSHRLMMCRKLR
jgi:hypothetical protein